MEGRRLSPLSWEQPGQLSSGDSWAASRDSQRGPSEVCQSSNTSSWSAEGLCSSDSRLQKLRESELDGRCLEKGDEHSPGNGAVQSGEDVRKAGPSSSCPLFRSTVSKGSSSMESPRSAKTSCVAAKHLLLSCSCVDQGDEVLQEDTVWSSLQALQGSRGAAELSQVVVTGAVFPGWRRGLSAPPACYSAYNQQPLQSFAARARGHLAGFCVGTILPDRVALASSAVEILNKRCCCIRLSQPTSLRSAACAPFARIRGQDIHRVVSGWLA